MTTPTGTISASDINFELGFSNTATMSLNDAAVRALAAVPSGTISYNDLRGKSNFIVDIRNASYNAFEFDGTVAGFRINVDGRVFSRYNNSFIYEYDWITPRPPIVEFEVFVVPTSFNVSVSGPLNIWTNLNTNPQWSISASGTSEAEATLTVSIRQSGSLNTIDTATILLTALSGFIR